MIFLRQTRIYLLFNLILCVHCSAPDHSQEFQTNNPFPGERGKDLDTYSREDIWDHPKKGFLADFVKVPRDSIVAFALYTHESGKLKMSAQLFPLQSNEKREVTLEIKIGGRWKKMKTAPVIYPGWSAQFVIPDWDNSKDVVYRVVHPNGSTFEGLIRHDPVEKSEIVVAALSCNSNHDRGDRQATVDKISKQDPDLLFFAGDQSYDHMEHTAAWLLWGIQFREVIRNRPVVTIPDDHDIGQGNIWGEGGKVADSPAGSNGGYYYPPEYINMVQRCQTWHLPDPADPAPVQQNIGVYFTRLHVGGVDFAIIEDRKFKSGPEGKIPQMGPRPDHVTEEGYDPKKIDLPGLKLLGDRQLHFLHDWGQDWNGAEMKAVLSQTAFCGAVHIHGTIDNRLLADLDCDGWPQTGRNKALSEIRRAMATHICGDQHLAVIVKHGIETFRDGPFAFTVPAMVNNYYLRWWWPKDENRGSGVRINNELPWTGDYLDGLYNKITMYAYANPYMSPDEVKEAQKSGKKTDFGSGYGLIRFNKLTRRITFECWPRFADLAEGDRAQFDGWPLTFQMLENDGRQITGYLPELHFRKPDPVVQVVRDDTGEILYTFRIRGERFRPQVYSGGSFTVKAGQNKPDQWEKKGLTPDMDDGRALEIDF